MSAKFLALADLPAWLAELAATFTVYAPRKEGGAVVYRPWQEGVTCELFERPTESAKHVLLPRSEELFRFRYAKDPQEPGLRKPCLNEPEASGPALVFGLLPCDARGFVCFDPVYGGGRLQDPYYMKRREEAVLVARACRSALSTCFCPWVGGDPAGKEGADALATDVVGGFVLEGLTDKGRAILQSGLLREASVEEGLAAQSAHAKARETFGPTPDLAEAPEALLAAFDDAEFWRDQSAACIACGACTYLCPTCYCFNITEESAGNAGVRLRSWDTCMSFQYTLEASGHNPRSGKAQRLRNRIGHKFAYYPRLHGGRILCTGCGRCIKSCPSAVDVRRIVQNALQRMKERADGM